jgi:hypothetical protein
VDSFIKKYSADFATVNEIFDRNGNDFILDKKVRTSWSKIVTLERKTTFKNIYDQTVYQRLYLGFYQYDTDKQCSAAEDSLLNCFGTDCDSFSWGDNCKSLHLYKIQMTNNLDDSKQKSAGYGSSRNYLSS